MITQEYLDKLKNGTEKELREIDTPWPDTKEELESVIDALTKREHTYGTAVYAMSLSAVASFNYASHMVGASGFQASCADMDFLGHTRHFKWGKILDYEKLLFPQYCNEEHFPSAWGIIKSNSAEFSKQARELLKKKSTCTHTDVVKHWKKLAKMGKEG